MADQFQHAEPGPGLVVLRSANGQIAGGLLGGVEHSEPHQVFDASDLAAIVRCHDHPSLSVLEIRGDTAEMQILTIETTCDETAAAVVTDELQVLSSVVASQDQLHQRFAGVVPEIAARAHVERTLPVIDEALRRANTKLRDLDAIAVANTPGLAGSLLVGLVAAKTLCAATGKPLVAINHLHAHIYACRMAAGREVFPYIGLIVSGGHTSLYRCDGPIDFDYLGGTIDDAAGEAFDKVAAMLGLPYPGGPAVAHAAEQGNESAYAFPRGLANDPDSL